MDIYQTPQGMLIHVHDCGNYLVSELDNTLCLQLGSAEWNQWDRDFFLGPGLVLALALRAVWSLHASAAMFKQKTVVFLGESGTGKSTLAAYLSKISNWNLVADDILPVEMIANEIRVLPHFPQLKLSMNTQPGAGLPERLPLDKVCVMKLVTQDAAPELELLPPSLAVQMLLRHTAGTRMFTPEMLGQHLSFCSQAASRIPVYQLSYPHRKGALPQVQELLEKIC
ncbi:MAG TPA: hypothetical protein VHP14_23480 [Anaerolineales bacterium]|nr:hypothetical protein [Anaerolineales bacterium]